MDGSVKRKGGFSQEEIREVMASRGKLSLAQALRCRVRSMTDGVVLGSAGFVNSFFSSKRAYFGVKRLDGARKLKGAEWGTVRTLRDLRADVIRREDGKLVNVALAPRASGCRLFWRGADDFVLDEEGASD